MAKSTTKKERPKKKDAGKKVLQLPAAVTPITAEVVDLASALGRVQEAIARRDLSDAGILDLMLRCGSSLAARRDTPPDARLIAFAEENVCYQTTSGDPYVSFYRGYMKVDVMPAMTEEGARNAGYLKCKSP